jgi:hypothetical protein
MFRRAIVLAAVVALQASACAGERPPVQPSPSAVDSSPAPAPAPAASVPVDTGKDCAKATARCAGGACDVTVTNDCDQAVRCAFELTATCETQSGTISVTGADRGLIGAHATSDLAAQTSCPAGPTRHTEVSKLDCK